MAFCGQILLLRAQKISPAWKHFLGEILASSHSLNTTLYYICTLAHQDVGSWDSAFCSGTKLLLDIEAQVLFSSAHHLQILTCSSQQQLPLSSSCMQLMTLMNVCKAIMEFSALITHTSSWSFDLMAAPPHRPSYTRLSLIESSYRSRLCH